MNTSPRSRVAAVFLPALLSVLIACVHDAKIDPSGKFVLFADSEETKITVFAIDQNTGALTNVPGSPFLAAQKVFGGGSPTVIAITH